MEIKAYVVVSPTSGVLLNTCRRLKKDCILEYSRESSKTWNQIKIHGYKTEPITSKLNQ